jgi:phage shock protein PspC (stress-responsive transcriptional regulator)
MSITAKRLTRSRDDRFLGGVCGGIAEYLGVDANLVRIVAAVCTILGAGSLVLVYIVALFLIPLEDKREEADEDHRP